MKKELIIKIVGYLLIAMMIGTVLFIFINSMLPPEKSTEQSDTIKDIIVEILPDNSKAENFVEEYIRKIAHFTEYGLLGIELAVQGKYLYARCFLDGLGTDFNLERGNNLMLLAAADGSQEALSYLMTEAPYMLDKLDMSRIEQIRKIERLGGGADS